MAVLVIGLLAQGRTIPELPCTDIAVPAGNKLAAKVYASGVQVYWWNGTIWSLIGPLAELYGDPGFNGKVGVHYYGPTWKSNSGSLVIGKRLAGCTSDPDSIQWLLLGADETDGTGIFAGVSFVQRLNTVGGKAPATPGYFGEEAHVPYTAEYYFYTPE
jgi:hypothetical protein